MTNANKNLANHIFQQKKKNSEFKSGIIPITNRLPRVDVVYRARIVKHITEFRGMDEILKIHIRIKDFPNKIYTYVVYISNFEDSRFYRFAEDMCLVDDGGNVDLRRLDYDEDIVVVFTEGKRGLLISEMYWISTVEGFDVNSEECNEER